MTEQEKENLRVATRTIKQDALVTGKAQYNEAALWGMADSVVQLITVILPSFIFCLATKDSTNLSLLGVNLNTKDIIAYFSLVVAISSGLKLSFNFPGRVKTHNDSASELFKLKDDAYNFEMLDLGKENIPEKELMSKFNSLNERRSNIRKSLTQHSGWSLKKANEGIEKGEASYNIDSKVSVS